MKKINYTSFTVIYTITSFILYNIPYLKKLQTFDSSLLFLASVTFISLLLLFILNSFFFWKKSTKIIASLLIIINGFALYFINTYNILIDKVMILNTLETQPQEILDLLSLKMIIYLVFFILFPIFLIYRTDIVYPKFSKLLRIKALNILIALLLASIIIFPNYKMTSQFVRNNKDIRYILIPLNYLSGTFSIVKNELKPKRELIKIGEDAKLTPYWKNNKKNLFVFVVGETARAQDFSLGGYSQPTNEPLDEYKENIQYFNNTSSCGTATAVSVPCIFSRDTRENYKNGSAQYTENLLDILSKSGYQTTWVENNSSCKKNCDRIETIKACEIMGKCNDEVMNKILEDKISQGDNNNRFIVLHQLGSHGPTYYKRFPKEFEKFKPYCKTEILSDCSDKEIMNVYDNTLYYTSHNLAENIKTLEKFSDKYNIVLFYVSDHGESLGEKGLYLHGAPYIFAPKEQTHVPFFVWMNDETSKNLGLNKECLKSKLSQEISQDYIFHSVLALSGINTKEYDSTLDIFKGCLNND
ncbi:MAG: phosphoethanolamine transferase [Alphaproteobacteria bacterium]